MARAISALGYIIQIFILFGVFFISAACVLGAIVLGAQTGSSFVAFLAGGVVFMLCALALNHIQVRWFGWG